MSDNSSRASVGSVSADLLASSYVISPAKQVMAGAKFPQFENHINISKIKIYGSNRRPEFDENSKPALDLKCGDKTREAVEEVIPHAFNQYGLQFSSKLFFDVYDHFGLDDEDVKKITASWVPFVPCFTLKRWKEYDKKYKPFVTRIPIKEEFSDSVAWWL